MNRAVGYIRVSTADQRENGVSLSAQREKITMYCKLHDIELVDILEDAGLSGKNFDRPELQKALGMLKSGAAQAVIVYKLDRLTRSMGDFHSLLREYFGNDKPYALISVTDLIDTKSSQGTLVVNIMMAVAQFESDISSERTKMGLAYRKSQGLHHGETPFGYTTEDGVLVPGEDYCHIKDMLKLRAKGYGVDKIAKHLNDHNVPTQRGGSWSGTTVKRILDRESKVA